MSLLRRIKGIKYPYEDDPDASLHPPLADRLGEILQRHRPKSPEFLAQIDPEAPGPVPGPALEPEIPATQKELEATSSPKQAGIEIPVVPQPESRTEAPSFVESTPPTHPEIRQMAQTVTTDAKRSRGRMAVAMGPLPQVGVDASRENSTPDNGNQVARKLRDQAQVARREAHAAVDSIHLAAKEAVAQWQTAQQKMEATFKSRVEEYQKRLVELSSAMEGLRRKSDALLEGFQGQLQNALKGLEQNVTKGVADEAKKQLASMTQASFEPFTKAATEEFRSHLRKTLDEFLAKSVRAFEAEHAESMRQHREAIQNQFDNLTKSRLEEHRWGYVAVQHTPKPRATGLRAGLTAGLGLAAVALILVPISLKTSRGAVAS